VISNTSKYLDFNVHILQWSSELAGRVSYLIRQNGELFFETPGEVLVVPGPLNFENSVYNFQDQTYKAGTEGSFYVQVKDQFNNVRFDESDQSIFLVEQISEADDSATDLSTTAGFSIVMNPFTGFHTFTFTPTAKGRLRWTVEDPTLGISMGLEMEIMAGAVSADSSTIGGAGFESGAVAGEAASFQLQALDANGNPVELIPGQTDFVPEFTDPTTGLPFDPPVEFEVIELGPPGMYEIVYIPPVSPTGADYTMEVQVFLADSATGAMAPLTPPQTLTVFTSNAPINPALSYIEDGGSRKEVVIDGVMKNGRVGTSYTFFLQLIDDNGVQVSTQPTDVQVFLSILNMAETLY